MAVQYQIFQDEDGSETISLYRHGALHAADQDHPNFRKIKTLAMQSGEAAKAGDKAKADELTNKVFELVNIPLAIEGKFLGITDRISVMNGRVFLDGDEIDNALTNQLLRALDEGDEVEWIAIANFYEKLQTNPLEHSRRELRDWLASYPTFTITPEGDIIAYKGVHKDRLSKFEGEAIVNGKPQKGKISNHDGALIEMSRSKVKHDPNYACNVGLHVATERFARGFVSGGVTLAVVVNPRDVVSVPRGDAEKMRVCRYKVLSEVTEPYSGVVLKDIPKKTAPPKAIPGFTGHGGKPSAKKKQSAKPSATTKPMTTQSPLEVPKVNTYLKNELGKGKLKPFELVAELHKRFGVKTTKDSIRRFKTRHGI